MCASRRPPPSLSRVVFTHGCFDVLHVGHVRLLRWARRLGDSLVVGLNTDASVRRNKGPHRPIVPERERYEMLKALAAVDEVILFPEDTADRLIRGLRPTIVVKGPACAGDFPERDMCMAVGARVLVPDWPVTHSTTQLLTAIRGGCDGRDESKNETA